LDFSAFFAAFLATFAAFFALLVFSHFCGPPIVVARSWAALCMSQGPPIFKEPFFLIESFSPVAQNFPALRPRALALLDQPASAARWFVPK
jgi:hypothetical protein